MRTDLSRLARGAMLFALGALVGTAADQIHVRAGVLSYPHPSRLLAGQPLWVPLLFGAAGVVLPLGNALLLRLARDRAEGGSIRGLSFALAWFFAAYASTALFQATPLLLTVSLVLVWCLRVAVSPTRDELLAGPLFALGGTLFEGGLSSTGAFHYHHADVLRVPAWLPALYLHASLMTRQACLSLLEGRRAGGRGAGSRS